MCRTTDLVSHVRCQTHSNLWHARVCSNHTAEGDPAVWSLLAIRFRRRLPLLKLSVRNDIKDNKQLSACTSFRNKNSSFRKAHSRCHHCQMAWQKIPETAVNRTDQGVKRTVWSISTYCVVLTSVSSFFPHIMIEAMSNECRSPDFISLWKGGAHPFQRRTIPAFQVEGRGELLEPKPMLLPRLLYLPFSLISYVIVVYPRWWF